MSRERRQAAPARGRLASGPLPVTSLKVDRSFTAGLPHDGTSATIVKAVIGLAEDLGITCVVEGSETAEQLSALPPGVLGQGFLLGRPVSADRAAELLSEWAAATTPTAGQIS